MAKPDDVMTREELLQLPDDALLKLCRMDRYRATGPGGQHRNKVDSAVRLTLEPHPEVTASATEDRSQHKNKQTALKRLRIEIAYVLREERAPRWEGQLKFNLENPQYPVFLGRVLDALTQNEWRLGDAARALNLSTGKINRVLFQDSRLWEYVNRQRETLGMGRLRPPK